MNIKSFYYLTIIICLNIIIIYYFIKFQFYFNFISIKNIKIKLDSISKIFKYQIYIVILKKLLSGFIRI